MADFYWDEGTSIPFAGLMEPLGHDVVIARTFHPQRTSDHVHLATATRLGRILVTHNRDDFLLLHRAWRDWFNEWGPSPPPIHTGIIILPQPPHLDSQGAAAILDRFVRTERPSAGIANRIFEWRRVGGWRELH